MRDISDIISAFEADEAQSEEEAATLGVSEGLQRKIDRIDGLLSKSVQTTVRYPTLKDYEERLSEKFAYELKPDQQHVVITDDAMDLELDKWFNEPKHGFYTDRGHARYFAKHILNMKYVPANVDLELTQRMLNDIQDFIDKVDRGEARSKRSYAAFKRCVEIAKEKGFIPNQS